MSLRAGRRGRSHPCGADERRSRSRRLRSGDAAERGGAGLVVLACACAALCAGAAVLGLLLDAALVRARAQTAADAAALAAVSALPLVGGDGAACGAAERIATANGAILAHCEPPGDGRGLSARVRVTVIPASPVVARLLPGVDAEAAAALRPTHDF